MVCGTACRLTSHSPCCGMLQGDLAKQAVPVLRTEP